VVAGQEPETVRVMPDTDADTVQEHAAPRTKAALNSWVQANPHQDFLSSLNLGSRQRREDLPSKKSTIFLDRKFKPL
jgi:hypothetical protein